MPRTVVQTDQAELPAKKPLQRECKRHQDSDMLHVHSKSAPYGHAEATETDLHLLGIGHHGQDYVDELCRFL